MRDEPIQEWLGALASRTPAPGGGAAAALAAATAAALVSMVAAYTTGDRWADRSDQMEAVDAEAAELRTRAMGLAEADAVAFGQVGSAYAMPKATPGENAARDAAIQAALLSAAEPPRQVGGTAIQVLGLAEGLVKVGNPNVISDVAVASSLARSALEAAIVNIEINRAMITDADVRAQLARSVDELHAGVASADSITASVLAKLHAS